MRDIIQCDQCKGHGFLVEDPAYTGALFWIKDRLTLVAVEDLPPRYIAPGDNENDFSDLNPICCNKYKGWGCSWKNKEPGNAEIK